MSTPSPSAPWTIKKLLSWTRDYLQKKGIPRARLDAELLLSFLLGMRRIDLYLHYDQPLNPDELKSFKALLARRLKREPLPYITGTQEFWSLAMEVSPDTLIPRPETELLVEEALRTVRSFTRPEAELMILDLCTGCGPCAVAMATEIPGARFIASDISPATLALARRNARRHGVADRIRFVCCDLLSPLHKEARFDLILANPPYIRSGEIGGLQPEVSRFEPIAAIDGGPDGMQFHRRIIETAAEHLNPSGWLMMEIGQDQASPLGDLIHNCPAYGTVDVVEDYSRDDRILKVRLRDW